MIVILSEVTEQLVLKFLGNQLILFPFTTRKWLRRWIVSSLTHRNLNPLRLSVELFWFFFSKNSSRSNLYTSISLKRLDSLKRMEFNTLKQGYPTVVVGWNKANIFSAGCNEKKVTEFSYSVSIIRWLQFFFRRLYYIPFH